MDVVQLLVLALVQGIAEFLPISSSGQLIVVRGLYESWGYSLDEPLTVTIVLHAGTLGSVLVVYWKRIVRLLTVDRRVCFLLAVGTLPAVIVGMPLKWYAADLLIAPLLTGCMLPVTGILLLWSGHYTEGDIPYIQMTFRQALIIGIFQAVAILPGISRSGATISAGLWVGLRREDSATFSFLLSIPTISGACLWEFLHLLRQPSPVQSLGFLAFFALVAFLVGILALYFLLRLLSVGRLHWFAYYCFMLGGLVIVWQLSI